ncbi:MAG: hypothetical protein ACYDA9_02140 [Terriglobia bacterium]
MRKDEALEQSWLLALGVRAGDLLWEQPAVVAAGTKEWRKAQPSAGERALQVVARR